jgi:hypothetical protein
MTGGLSPATYTLVSIQLPILRKLLMIVMFNASHFSNVAIFSHAPTKIEQLLTLLMYNDFTVLSM